MTIAVWLISCALATYNSPTIIVFFLLLRIAILNRANFYPLSFKCWVSNKTKNRLNNSKQNPLLSSTWKLLPAVCRVPFPMRCRLPLIPGENRKISFYNSNESIKVSIITTSLAIMYAGFLFGSPMVVELKPFGSDPHSIYLTSLSGIRGGRSVNEKEFFSPLLW